MEYTEAVDREIEALEVFEKKSGLTEVGKKKIKALRKCRDDFKKLHLPVVGVSFSVGDMENFAAYMLIQHNGGNKKKTWEHLKEWVANER